jgi:hypothetical protein
MAPTGKGSRWPSEGDSRYPNSISRVIADRLTNPSVARRHSALDILGVDSGAEARS